MGKRRTAAKKSHGGAEGTAATSTNTGGALAAFDFNDDDKRVEDEERKAMAKYGKIPSKKRARRPKSLEKYHFLECCKYPRDYSNELLLF